MFRDTNISLHEKKKNNSLSYKNIYIINSVNTGNAASAPSHNSKI